MKWYFLVLQKKYSLFEGRARRREYWWFTFLWALIFLFLSAVDLVLGWHVPVVGMGSLALLYLLATLVPSLTLSVRRLHDIGLSGWLLLLHLVPYIGSLVLLIAAMVPGRSEANRFGPDPKLEVVA